MKMKVLDLIKKRYAAKLFTGEKISEKDFDQIIESIRLAPSSFNLQPWKIKIIEDKEILEKLEEASYGQKQISTCSHLIVFCAIENLEENKEKLLEVMRENVSEEKFKVFEKMLEDYFCYRPSLELVGEKELFMALENAMLCATDLGYASCPMGGFDRVKYREILNIPLGLNPVVICPIGIPVDESKEKFRFSKEEIVF